MTTTKDLQHVNIRRIKFSNVLPVRLYAEAIVVSIMNGPMQSRITAYNGQNTVCFQMGVAMGP